MATLIPTLNSCLSRMTPGEKRLARLLEAKLEEDYYCWYDVPVGKKALHPDFIILHPARGILVIEVKDWKTTTLVHLNREEATLQVETGLIKVKNPLLQARNNIHHITNLLEQDPQLVFSAGPRQGQLMFPYAHGVVLTNFSRKQYHDAQLHEVLTEHLVICKDEMFESVDAEAFQNQLWGMFAYKMKSSISLPQVNRIRWHIFPEIRVPEQKNLFSEGNAVSADLPNVLKIMDIQQEQLARSLGEGHRIIHGVAGSGKTMILGYRAQYLAQMATRPILVLCFNHSLAQNLASTMKNNGIADKVNATTFHHWCREQLKTYGIPLPNPNPQDKGSFHRECVERVIQYIDNKIIPSGQYDAILIDEGHDFQESWFKLIVQMINPSSNSLLVLYDDAQSIYNKDKRHFTFSRVGIQARGRTTILKLNYRNTIEILAVAKAFAEELLHAENADEDSAPIIEPEGAGINGPLPLLIKLPTIDQECERIADILLEHYQAGMPWKDMSIIYRWKYFIPQITKSCQKRGIPIDEKSHLNDAVHLLTMHASKGLEFPLVCIPGIGVTAKYELSSDEEARLLYVAMTRATKQLVMTHGEKAQFTDKLERALHKTASMYGHCLS